MSTIVREIKGISPELVDVKIRYPDHKDKKKLRESESEGSEYLGNAGKTVPDGAV
jgi:hypothetical protein